MLFDHVFLILVSQVSHLLAPALDKPPEFGPSTVPCDRQDMFTRLATLLSFEAAPLDDTVSYVNLTTVSSHMIYTFFLSGEKHVHYMTASPANTSSTTLVTAIE